MLANDIQQGPIRKALLVIADRRRGVNARENRRLAGCALGASFNPQPRIGNREGPIEGNYGLFVLKYCQWRRAVETVERIVRPARTDAQAINKKQQYRWPSVAH
jgi:hypothetical protein